MLVEHYIRDFYNLLLGERVLLFTSHHDVDSLCMTKILQQMFKIDMIQYILVSVGDVNELKESFKDYIGQVKFVILINCGGMVDLMELLEYPNGVQFFIIDSHRPIHIFNIYDHRKQVHVLAPTLGHDVIPEFDEIFREEDSDPDDDDDDTGALDEDEDGQNSDSNSADDEDGGGRRKRRRLNKARKRRNRANRREWEKKRRNILFRYTQYNSHGPPSSLVGLEIAWKLSRSEPEVIWWSVMGLTEYLTMKRFDRSTYTLFLTDLQGHVSRATHSRASKAPLDVLKINFENDIDLFLYRNWTLYESMKFTPHWCTNFRIWTVKGLSKFHQYLAEVGLPLFEVREKFTHMNRSLRMELKEILASRAERYQLPGTTIGTFYASFGYKFRFSAIDNHLATLSLLESPNVPLAPERFHTALCSLAKEKSSYVTSGIDDAKRLLTTIYSQVQAFLELQQVQDMGPFLYAVVQEGGIDTRYFSKPNSLLLLCYFTYDAFTREPKNKRHKQNPLIMFAPYENTEYLLTVGIPPSAADTTQNMFGKAFETVMGKLLPGDVKQDFFDTTFCLVKNSVKDKFLEVLLSLLL